MDFFSSWTGCLLLLMINGWMSEAWIDTKLSTVCQGELILNVHDSTFNKHKLTIVLYNFNPLGISSLLGFNCAQAS